MPLKPREQWKPNIKLQAAREEAFGKKSRTRFASAVKRRCQQLYGGHCGVDHRTVRRWEQGACEPDVCHQQAICDVLDMPWEARDQLGFTVPGRESAPPAGMPRADPTPTLESALVGECPVCRSLAATAALAVGSDEDEESGANRWEFLRDGAAVVVGAASSTTWFKRMLEALNQDGRERLMAAINRPATTDAQSVEHLNTVLSEYRHLDDRIGSASLSEAVTGQLAVIGHLLRGAESTKIRQALCSTAAQSLQFLGWLSFNMGDVASAQAYYQDALKLAERADDQALVAYVLGWISWCTPNSDIQTAVNSAQVAQDRAVRVTPGMRSWLAGVEAWAYGRADRAEETRRSLERAEQVLAGFEREAEPSWIYWYTPEALVGYSGFCHVQLHQPELARTALFASLGCMDTSCSRTRSIYLHQLAETYIDTEDIDEACRLIGESVPLAAGTSKRSLQAIRDLRVRLKPWDDSEAVKCLDQQLLLV
jgi:tetratricopeptide (TPR) repeat protein